MGKKVAILVTVCVMIIVVVFFEFFVFITPTQQSNDPYSAQYYAEFNKIPTLAYTYSFSPPVSMYHALLIALESGGWNATSLENMLIHVELDYCVFFFPPDGTGFERYPVTHSVADWSPKQVNGTTYRYAWAITVGGSAGAMIYFVDVVTAELVLTRVLTIPVP